MIQELLWSEKSLNVTHPQMDSDGDHSPGEVAFNGPDPVTEPEASAEPVKEDEAVKERIGRPRRPAKPTSRPSEYFYFYRSSLSILLGKLLSRRFLSMSEPTLNSTR